MTYSGYGVILFTCDGHKRACVMAGMEQEHGQPVLATKPIHRPAQATQATNLAKHSQTPTNGKAEERKACAMEKTEVKSEAALRKKAGGGSRQIQRKTLVFRTMRGHLIMLCSFKAS